MHLDHMQGCGLSADTLVTTAGGLNKHWLGDNDIHDTDCIVSVVVYSCHNLTNLMHALLCHLQQVLQWCVLQLVCLLLTVPCNPVLV